MKFRSGAPIYDYRGYVLCTCDDCGNLNYVEPHGVTEACFRCGKRTQHTNIPYDCRDVSATRMMRKPGEEKK